MSLLTAAEITNLYLYGNKTKPENIESESLIRSDPLTVPTSTKVNINEYMTTGPGRFASPAKFELIKQFFTSQAVHLDANTPEKPYYTKTELFAAFGINTGWVGLQQSLYDDGADNYLERAYIWESTAFQIDENAKFVVEANGTRYIKDFAIVPFSENKNTEDFDFKSDSGFSKLVNFALEPLVDPSGIGRTVVISFGGNRILKDTFTYQDYTNAVSTALLPNPGLAATIAANGYAFTQQLFDSGLTKFLDTNNKPILYGSDNSDLIFGTISAEHIIDYKTHTVTRVDIAPGGINRSYGISGYVQNGIHYIGGKGNDRLFGTTNNDYFDGGAGFDTYSVSNGDVIVDKREDLTMYGKVKFDGEELIGGKQDEASDIFKDKLGYAYKFITGGSLEVTAPNKTSTITIQNFQNGDLGINLIPAQQKGISGLVSWHEITSVKVGSGSSYHLGKNPAIDKVDGLVKTSLFQSPIVLDLNNNGINTLSMDAGVHFDLDGNGFAELTGWVDSQDGLLVYDRNGNGKIDNGNELFGSETLLASGEKASHGYQALAELDSNHDNNIDAQDAAYAVLKIWKDYNADGISTPNELMSLPNAGVNSVACNFTSVNEPDSYGNTVRQSSSYVNSEGNTLKTGDVWFATNPIYSQAVKLMPESTDVATLPDLSGYGNVYSLHQAMLRDPSGHLQSLVQQFMAEPDYGVRRSLITPLLYAWSGVEGIDPLSRGTSSNPNFDARKFATLEAVLEL